MLAELLIGTLVVATPQAVSGRQPTSPAAPTAESSDTLRRRAAAEAADGRLADALATIDRARRMAPDDLDVRLARARILHWLGRTVDARAEADAVASRSPGYPELADLRIAMGGLDKSASRSGFAASIGLATVDIGATTQIWRSASVAGFTSIGHSGVLTADVDLEDRRTTDVRGSIRLDRKVGTTDVFMRVAATPDATFRERWSLSAGLSSRLGRSLDATLSARHASYADVAVTVIEPGASIRVYNERIAVSARWINLFRSDGPRRDGVSARVDVDVGHDRALIAGAASYPDTEAGVTRLVRAFYVGAVAPVSERVSVRLTLDHERRERSYVRRGVVIGFIWRPGR